MTDLLTCTPSVSPPSVTVPRLYRLADLLAEWEDVAIATHDAFLTGIPRGPITGFAKLDTALGGVLMPGLHFLHGQPGTGKSALALQIAASCRCPALLLTVEMSPLELFRRLMARVTGQFLGTFKSGEMTPAHALDCARRTARALPDLMLVDGTACFVSPEQLREMAFVCRGDARHLLLLVDSAHSWADSSPCESVEYDALNACLNALRGIAHELRCPALVVAERNRSSMKQGGLNAIAGTRKFEYIAESILDLTRDDLPPDGRGFVNVLVKVMKNRHGAPGPEIALQFHGGRQRFEEL